MKFQAAYIEKDGRTIAIAKVSKDVLDVPGRARDTISLLQPVFPDMAIVLVARDSKGKLFFFGRPDIVNHLGEVTLRDAEWKEHTVD